MDPCLLPPYLSYGNPDPGGLLRGAQGTTEDRIGLARKHHA